ncbi:phage tail protein I [Acuticoccus sp. M5D2P5]|uniref:phage tail protein I n=1 Tax=Acuticoccus kalidii TaxID=2910977 RepID=UPI001F4429F5|nr:phage tail protein I [Acuticoccus kalidii]MCF3935005.1 phage tail protein I [Acuticoccus kalidii]
MPNPSPIAGLGTPSATYSQGQTFGSPSEARRSQPVVMRGASVTFPATWGNYILFEVGNNWFQDGAQIWISVSGGQNYITLRFGDGGTSATRYVGVNVSALGLEGETHDLTWEFDPVNKWAKLWLDNDLIGEGGDWGADWTYDVWTGNGDGGWGRYGGDGAPASPSTAWPSSSLGTLSIWYNTQSTWAPAPDEDAGPLVDVAIPVAVQPIAVYEAGAVDLVPIDLPVAVAALSVEAAEQASLGAAGIAITVEPLAAAEAAVVGLDSIGVPVAVSGLLVSESMALGLTGVTVDITIEPLSVEIAEAADLVGIGIPVSIAPMGGITVEAIGLASIVMQPTASAMAVGETRPVALSGTVSAVSVEPLTIASEEALTLRGVDVSLAVEPLSVAAKQLVRFASVDIAVTTTATDAREGSTVGLSAVDVRLAVDALAVHLEEAADLASVDVPIGTAPMSAVERVPAPLGSVSLAVTVGAIRAVQGDGVAFTDIRASVTVGTLSATATEYAELSSVDLTPSIAPMAGAEVQEVVLAGADIPITVEPFPATSDALTGAAAMGGVNVPIEVDPLPAHENAEVKLGSVDVTPTIERLPTIGSRRDLLTDNRLLPLGSTPQELAFDDVFGERIDTIPVDLRLLYRPQDIPDGFIPWLGWSVSADIWRRNWDAETKRRITARMLPLHRIKGTEGAFAGYFEAIGARLVDTLTPSDRPWALPDRAAEVTAAWKASLKQLRVYTRNDTRDALRVEHFADHAFADYGWGWPDTPETVHGRRSYIFDPKDGEEIALQRWEYDETRATVTEDLVERVTIPRRAGPYTPFADANTFVDHAWLVDQIDPEIITTTVRTYGETSDVDLIVETLTPSLETTEVWPERVNVTRTVPHFYAANVAVSDHAFAFNDQAELAYYDRWYIVSRETPPIDARPAGAYTDFSWTQPDPYTAYLLADFPGRARPPHGYADVSVADFCFASEDDLSNYFTAWEAIRAAKALRDEIQVTFTMAERLDLRAPIPLDGSVKFGSRRARRRL